MDPANAPSPSLPSVTISQDRDLELELVQRAERLPPVASVFVTDLVDPRKAFWSRTARPPMPADRQLAVLEGRRLHARLLRVLGPAEAREVRVRRRGIAGAIDMFDTLPIELKSTGRLPELAAIVTERPAYVEQLAMYCAMVGRTAGRLVLVAITGESPTAALVADLTIRSPDAVLDAMRARVERLRDAWSRASPDRLPRCAWVRRGCEYEAAGVCDCTGEEPAPADDVLGHVGPLEDRPELARDLLDAARRLVREPPPLVESFRDLAYPRRTYFERVEPHVGRPAEPLPGRDDLWSAVSELLESGLPGEVERRWVPGGQPVEPVLMFRGAPLLLKSTRARRGRPLPELPARQPHYLLELGLRCAALGVSEGRLLLAYETGRTWAERLEAARIQFEPLDPWTKLVARRRSELADAIERHEPAAATACPRWMFDRCAYRSACRCDGAETTAPPHR